MKQNTLIIACGALSNEIIAIKDKNKLSFDISCLNANLHNHPDKIPAEVEKQILKYKTIYSEIFIAFADCGTGGILKKIADKYNLEMLPGAHCYQFFSAKTFDNIKDDDLGTFYLTDFLAKHFDRLIIKEMQLDKSPELRDIFFSNYTKLLYIIQDEQNNFRDKAKQAAKYLNLEYSEIFSGYGELEHYLTIKTYK